MESNFKDMNSKPIYIENTIENAINMDKNIIKFYTDEKNLALANGDILVNKLDKYMNNFANDMLYCFESECVPKNHIKNHIKSQLWFGKYKSINFDINIIHQTVDYIEVKAKSITIDVTGCKSNVLEIVRISFDNDHKIKIYNVISREDEDDQNTCDGDISKPTLAKMYLKNKSV
eukprot:804978_1